MSTAILSTSASNQAAQPPRDARSVGRHTERRTRKSDTPQNGQSERGGLEMGSKGLTVSIAICPFCKSAEASLEVYSNNGVSRSAHITCPDCGMKTKNLLNQVFEGED